MTTAYEWFVGLLDAIGSEPIGKPNRQCPAHSDGAPSLAISQGDDGRVLVRCHAGCTTKAVMDALRCPMARLFKPATTPPRKFAATFLAGIEFPPIEHKGGRSLRTSGYHLDAVHDYGPDYRVLRWRKGSKKEMVWESRNHLGEMVPGLLGTPTSALPLYRIREVRMAIAMEETVVLVESESSVDALAKVGVYGCTWAGGASSPPLRRLADELGHANVLLVPDHDDPGLACAEQIVRALPDARVQLGDPGQDARDILAAAGAEWFR